MGTTVINNDNHIIICIINVFVLFFSIIGSIGEAIQNFFKIDYEDIPNFPQSTVDGHHGKLIFGYISNVPVVCMQGRFHYYEGYQLSTCVMPIRLMKLLGVTHLIASNAAGAINQDYKVGDIMLQKDHYNIMGLSGIGPLIGYNDPRWGPRFFAMTKAYDPDLLEDANEICKGLAISGSIHQGVYTCLGGPNFETVAEIRGLKALGIDAAGMSTVHEVIAARHCRIKCFAFSLITNICSVEYDCPREANSEEVLYIGQTKETDLNIFIENLVDIIGRKYLYLNCNNKGKK